MNRLTASTNLAVGPRGGEGAGLPGARVTRVLRCTKSRRYYRSGGWTEDVRQATVFKDQPSAIIACLANGLEEAELVLRIDDIEVFKARIQGQRNRANSL